MVLSDFFVPCGLLLGTVFVSFLCMCWFFHATYIKSLQQRIRRLEYMIEPPSRNTTGDVAFQARKPLPIRPSRYVTVERAPKPEYYRQGGCIDGEEKLFVVTICVTVICITILYSFLFIALWDHREWVGLSLLAVLIASAAIFLRGRLTEQDVRLTRYRHLEETPLDERGEPQYWRQEYQPNPHRR